MSQIFCVITKWLQSSSITNRHASVFSDYQPPAQARPLVWRSWYVCGTVTLYWWYGALSGWRRTVWSCAIFLWHFRSGKSSDANPENKPYHIMTLYHRYIGFCSQTRVVTCAGSSLNHSLDTDEHVWWIENRPNATYLSRVPNMCFVVSDRPHLWHDFENYALSRLYIGLIFSGPFFLLALHHSATPRSLSKPILFFLTNMWCYIMFLKSFLCVPR